MFSGLCDFLKKIIPKRLFYRALLIVAIPVLVLQLVITIVFFDSLWIKTNKGMTRTLVNEISTFIEAYASEQENKKKLATPVILLTAKGEANERVEGLEIGADDYLPKPFEPKELILRIQNILNKTIKTAQKRVIEFANVKIDLNKLLIFKSDKEFKINATEKTILEKMINNPGKTFSREDIAQFINLDKERSIDVIITRLRKKIEIDPKNPKFLQTIRGAGYVLWIE